MGVQGADMEILSQIAPPTRKPLQLKGLDFKSMFKWLSASAIQVSHSQLGVTTMIKTPAVGWSQIPIDL